MRGWGLVIDHVEVEELDAVGERAREHHEREPLGSEVVRERGSLSEVRSQT